jgi:hypothetical protein
LPLNEKKLNYAAATVNRECGTEGTIGVCSGELLGGIIVSQASCQVLCKAF